MSTTVQKSDQCAGSDKRLTWAISTWAPRHSKTEKIDVRSNEGHYSSVTIHDVQVCLQEVLRMPQKNEVKASEVLHLPRQNDLNMLTWKMKTVSQDQQAGFHNIVQVNQMLRLTQNWRHLVLWPTPANVLAMCPMSCACHTKQSCDPPKLPNLLPLPHKRQIAPKTDTARSREHKDFL